MGDQNPASEALAAYRVYLQNPEAVHPEFRRQIEEQTGRIQQIVAGTREIAAHIDGNRGTIRFVRQIAFKGNRSIMVSEDSVRAEIQRTTSGWRITKAMVDDRPEQPGTEGSEGLDVGAAEFTREVLESPIPVLVHFGADWSAPCNELARTLAVVAAEHAERLNVRRVDVMRSGAIAAQYGIEGVPTLLLFDSGKVRAQLVGSVPKADIDQFLRSNGLGAR